MKRALLWAATTLPVLAFAQGLQPGDSFSAPQPFKALNHTAQQLLFDHFKGKPLLLDFWFTSCTACLANIPRLDSIQKKYDNQLQIVLVTWEKKEKVAAMLNGYKRLRGITLPVIVEDVLLHRLFPHESVPHKVWIDAEGKVRAITDNSALTPVNLAAFIGSQPLGLPQKEWASATAGELPAGQLLTNDRLWEKPPLQYLFLGEDRPHLAAKPAIAVHDSARRVLHIRAVNNTLSQLYKSAWTRAASFHEARVVFEAKEECRTDSMQRKLYCFEMISTDTVQAKAYARMRQYLDAALGYSSSLQERNTPVWLLKRQGGPLRLSTSGSTPDVYVKDGRRIVENVRFSAIVNNLLNSPGYLPRPVVDETGYTGRADMELPASFTDLPSFNRALKKYGLCLEEGTRKMELIVLQTF